MTKQTKATCSVEGCGSVVLAKALSHSHYQTGRLSRIRAERRAVVRLCPQCGVEFSGRSPVAVYCSERCSEIAHQKRRPSKPPRPGKVDGACAQCGTSLVGRRANAEFCSQGCWRRFHDIQRLEARNATLDRKCVTCNEPLPGVSIAARYCSAACRRLAERAARYNMTPAELYALRDASCGICGSLSNLHIDHDHKTGVVRGVLCTSCNNGLGRFQDDPARILAAAAYLEKPLEG